MDSRASTIPSGGWRVINQSRAFLLYDSRSRSTLFSTLLNQYRGVSVSSESTFISRIMEFSGSLKTEKNLSHLVHYLYKKSDFRELQVDPNASLSAYSLLLHTRYWQMPLLRNGR